MTEGVNHSYTVIIHNVTIPSAPFVVVNTETVFVPNVLFEQCGEFEVQIKAINRASESKFSEAVRFSLPLLPDTQPISDSLSHRVWKSNGEIMVHIIFEVSLYILKLVQPSLNFLFVFVPQYSQSISVLNRLLQTIVLI